MKMLQNGIINCIIMYKRNFNIFYRVLLKEDYPLISYLKFSKHLFFETL